jgi:hypothetical protein
MAIGKVAFEAAVVVLLGEMLSVDWILPIFGLPHDLHTACLPFGLLYTKPMLQIYHLFLLCVLFGNYPCLLFSNFFVDLRTSAWFVAMEFCLEENWR